MRRFRIALTLLLAASLAVPPFAHADPVVTPETLHAIDFEGADATGGMTIGPFSLEPPYSAAWWGRITNRAHGGMYGLWAAGVQGDVPTVTPAVLAYPGASSGLATVDVTQTADYYRSYLSFWYTMPSRGADDGGSLNLGWDTIPATHLWTENSFALTGSNIWANPVYDLSQYPSSVNVSRQQARIRFWFHDFITDGAQGEGATVDDITVTGVKYGPPRSLVATQSGASVLVSWVTPPYRIDSSADDTRSMTYRVWRSAGTGPAYAWTELTGARQAARSFVDTTVPLGGPYTYTVQAWDPGTGTGNGEIATATVTTSDPLTFDKSATPTETFPGGSVTYSYVVTNTGDATLTIGVSDDKIGQVFSGHELAPHASRTATKSANLTTGTTNVGTMSAMDAHGRVLTKTDSVFVRVSGPSVRVTKAVDKPVVLQGAGVTYTYVVANTGTYDLTGVNLDDDKLGHIAGPFALNRGLSATYTRSATITADTSNVATATGASAVMTVTAVASTTVDVIHPHVTLTRSVDTSVQVAGGSVTHTLTVTNDGDVALSGVGIVDSQLGVVLSPRTLVPAATVTTVVVAPSLAGTVTYSAVASGTDALISTPVSSSATLTVSRRTPGVSITKTAGATHVVTGTVVPYTYVVRNTGDVTLAGLAVADDKIGPVVGAPAFLAPGAQTTLTASSLPLAVDTTNVATVIASYGASGTAFSGTHAASATAFVDVIAPELSLTVTVSRQVVLPSTPVTYTYTVRNSGDYPLTDVGVGSSRSGSVVSPCALGVGETTSAVRPAMIDADVFDLATVSGKAGQVAVSAAASTTVDVIHPHVTLARSLSAAVVVGATDVTHTITVTNDGDVPLKGVVVTDTVLGTVLGPLDLAAGGQTQKSAVASISNDTTFIASVTSTDAILGSVADDSETATVDVLHPALSLVKAVSPSSITLGASVTYTFTLTNGGDTPLEAISLTDDMIGPVASGISLASGESTQIARVRTPSVSESGAAHATGHLSLLPAEVVNASSADIGVIVNSPPPPPAPDPTPAPAPVVTLPSISGHTLYTPVTPSTVYYGRSFTVSSLLKPRHKAGLYSLKYEGYRYESGRWVRRATWYGKNYNYSTYTKCIKTGAVLKLRGKWRVRAVHTHTGYLPKYSGYRYFTVK